MRSWLENERQLIEREEWAPPAVRAAAKRRQNTFTIQAYAEQWLRTHKLRAPCATTSTWSTT